MNKIFRFLLLSFAFFVFQNSIFAETLEGKAVFTWDKLTQSERDDDIQKVKEQIFTDEVVYSYDKKAFKEGLSEVKKDSNYKMNIIAAKLGKTNLVNRVVVPFYAKKILYGYGLIFKEDKKRCYYYTALGGLFVIENFTKDYDDYPVVSYQYDTSGKLIAAVYSLSDVDEYMYSADGIFLGRWYKENYYNYKGKVIMSRVLP